MNQSRNQSYKNERAEIKYLNNTRITIQTN